MVGAELGVPVQSVQAGSRDGVRVGTAVGSAVGRVVGFAVGLKVGIWVGVGVLQTGPSLPQSNLMYANLLTLVHSPALMLEILTSHRN